MGGSQSFSNITFQGRAIRISDNDERKKVVNTYDTRQRPWESLASMMNQEFASYYDVSTARATAVTYDPPQVYNGNTDLRRVGRVTIPRMKWNFKVELKDDDVGTVSWSADGDPIEIIASPVTIDFVSNTAELKLHVV